MSSAISDHRRGDTSAVLDEARSLHSHGQLDRARSLYETVLASEPANADALHLLGLLRFQRGELAGAEMLMRQALAQRPEFVRAHSNLGAVLMAGERAGEAPEGAERPLDECRFGALGKPQHGESRDDRAHRWRCFFTTRKAFLMGCHRMGPLALALFNLYSQKSRKRRFLPEHACPEPPGREQYCAM